MDPAQLETLRVTLGQDSPEGDAARTALGLRWSAGPNTDFPCRRLVSSYRLVSPSTWAALRKEENR